MKPSKADRNAYRRYGPPRPNGVHIGIKLYCTTRDRIKVPGWKIVRRTRVRKNNTEVFCIYYRSSNHVQDFIDRMDIMLKRRDIRERVIKYVQYDPDSNEEFEDPNNWPYGLLILTNKPIDDEFEDWEIVSGPRSLDGVKNLWGTTYRCKEAEWDDLMETLRDDPEIGPYIERMIPDKKLEIDPIKRARNIRKSREADRRRKRFDSGIKGGSRKTKYEYPTGCNTKSERSKYRRQQRRKINNE